ncbi:hypothetical protein OPQ81_005153 [Rhizoctonia solani]|nr:hypothetical protein OPQ81_005153 [Rhizoctonia solani]
MEANELAILDSCLDGPRRARASSPDHFHQCGNGHTYVFAECIIVNGRKSCPECGIWIEDISHQQRNLIISHVARVPIPYDGAPHSSGNRGGAPLPFSSNRSRGTYRRGVPAPRLDNTQRSKAEVGPSNVASQANAPTPGDSAGRCRFYVG